MKTDKYAVQRVITNNQQGTLPQHQNQHHIGSLKALINQSRIPLSQYINDKRYKKTNNLAQMTYFDKMKAKFIKPEDEQIRQGLMDAYGVNPTNKIQSEQIHQSIEGYLAKINVPNQNPLSQTKRKDEVNDKQRKKDRSKSTNGHFKMNNMSQNQIFPIQQQTDINKRTDNQNQPETTHGVNRHMVESSKNIRMHQYMYPKFKELKKEVINYNKFTQIYRSSKEAFSGFIQINETLGRGANSIVRIGRDKRTQQMFAVKIYEKYKLLQGIKRKRVFGEIDILGSLDHSNIIKLTDCFQDKRQIHILFQYLPEACNLHDYLKIHSNQLSLAQKYNIAVQITAALEYLHHQGVAHRDLKTDNVVISSDFTVKLIDFGYATRAHEGQLVCGTPNYMAPELFAKKPIYNRFKVDVWALGILLFYLFEGRYPFRGYNEKQLARNISTCRYQFTRSNPFQKTIIQSLLQANAENRQNPSTILHHLKEQMQRIE